MGTFVYCAMFMEEDPVNVQDPPDATGDSYLSTGSITHIKYPQSCAHLA